MQRTFLTMCIFGVFAGAACGGNNPSAEGDDVVAPDADPSAPDAAPERACAAPPSRVIVVGDSIMACAVIGGPQGAGCVSKQLAEYVIETHAPGASYENFAVDGAKLEDLRGQIARIPAGTGPILLVVYMGGNDLAPYIFQSDESALAGWAQVSPTLTAVWTETFETLASDDRFADGVTVLMNTQYNPFDDCTAPPYSVSATKNGIVRMYNDELGTIAARAGDTAMLVHQFEPFLGHGHHSTVATCPHYQDGATPYMEDLIHANAAGNVALASVMKSGTDRLYRDCTD